MHPRSALCFLASCFWVVLTTTTIPSPLPTWLKHSILYLHSLRFALLLSVDFLILTDYCPNKMVYKESPLAQLKMTLFQSFKILSRHLTHYENRSVLSLLFSHRCWCASSRLCWNEVVKPQPWDWCATSVTAGVLMHGSMPDFSYVLICYGMKHLWFRGAFPWDYYYHKIELRAIKYCF